MNLSELKKKPIAELQDIANEMGLEGVARTRKQDVIFSILKAHAKNGESIYGTRGGPIPNGEWGGMAFKDNKIYVHVMNWPEDGSPLLLPSLDKKIRSSRGLNVKNPTVKQTDTGIEIELPTKDRDEIDSIIVLEI